MITAKYVSGTTSQQVHVGKCFLTDFFVFAYDVDFDVSLYDAEAPENEIRRYWPGTVHGVGEHAFVPPLEMKNGILVAVAGGTGFWCVGYIV